ncbi:MAG: energy transducer TonB [Methylocystaceae bacterium]|nr:energy transducer TonB [Methylocystaceae bacterium]
MLHITLAYAFFYTPSQKKIQGNKSQGALATSTLEANRADTATQQGGGRVVGTIKPDYVTTLRRWLEKHKTYPKNARRRRQEGVVILAFSVTRNGSVPEFQIQKGSGYKALDEETIQVLKRAQPFPKFPKDMEGNILKIALPIQFALR